jgi:hypothetical protein
MEVSFNTIKKQIDMNTEGVYEKTNDIEFSSRNENINVQIIIDTDKIINDYGTPSEDESSPIAIDHNYMYVVVSTPNAATGLENATNLLLSAEVGDLIRFNALSEYNNMDNSVLLCEIKKVKGTNVFGKFKSKVFNKIGIQAAVGESPLPAIFVKKTFWFYESHIKRTGKEIFSLKFALYRRIRGQKDPVLFGYFAYNQIIVIKNEFTVS